MNINDTHTEKLFSYGTLQYESVQQANFGRKLQGKMDSIVGFKLEQVTITDPHVLAVSGEATHPVMKHTGNASDQIAGVVFDISPKELEQADAYEVADYKRILVQLNSGVQAWVYVSAADAVAALE